MDFVWLLMSNSELLRIKNKQKRPYKNKRLQAVNIKYNKRPNDRFGFNRYCSMEKAKLKVSLTLIKKYTIRLDINTLAELNPNRLLGLAWILLF